MPERAPFFIFPILETTNYCPRLCSVASDQSIFVASHTVGPDSPFLIARRHTKSTRVSDEPSFLPSVLL